MHWQPADHGGIHINGVLAVHKFLLAADHSNNLAGTIAICFLITLYASSMTWVRRSYYQVIAPQFWSANSSAVKQKLLVSPRGKIFRNLIDAEAECGAQVFIRFHIVGFVGFILFSYIHYWQRWRLQTASESLESLF